MYLVEEKYMYRCAKFNFVEKSHMCSFRGGKGAIRKWQNVDVQCIEILTRVHVKQEFY